MFPAMAVLALNIADKCPNVANELVILHDGIPLEEQRKVNEIFPTVFIHYESTFADVENFSDTVKNWFSPLVFCKYECLKLLDRYKCVIWTDYDILIKEDISYLKDKDNFDCKVLGAKPLANLFMNDFLWQKSGLDDEKWLFEEDGVDLNAFGVSGALFVLFDTLPNYQNLYNQCIQLTKKYAKWLYMPE